MVGPGSLGEASPFAKFGSDPPPSLPLPQQFKTHKEKQYFEI